ncbi:hypothetical protein GWK90_00485 [Candidatus Hamiltonella defensa]|uniref:Uncharacterized protein n=1 Tax=Candidatus Williamhamiltonella defendens TaxID=138072 RepID=A0AAC9YGH9_9ENTR|nr:hypothetical protein [Candidatus Hamiltonella defensa]ASV33704.1 hypothetical protein CJJ18_06445 [Candidatus Hamiltonella defensa]AWK16658.1 hypothetical protein CCS40_06280 [Candidatus Hamiltonella defensa]MBK4360783.1 hypothetical protein [Candidatus Hamiltonella defensa]
MKMFKLTALKYQYQRLFFLMTFSINSAAVIELQPHILEIKNELSFFEVINKSPHVEYVLVELYYLNNPGVLEESLTPIGLINSPLLYAAPLKFTLGPQQVGKIYLKTLKTPEKEQLYRLAVIPKTSMKLRSSEMNAVLSVKLSYMGLIRHLPKKIKPDWKHRCTTNGVELKNTGNIRLSWTDIQNGNQKVRLNNIHLYPDQIHFISASDQKNISLKGKVNHENFYLFCKNKDSL